MTDDRQEQVQQEQVMNDTRHVVRTAPLYRTFTRPYWEATRSGTILVQFCTVAHRYQWPPGPTSRYSGRRTLEWREIEGKGTVHSFTVAHQARGDLRGHEPYLLAAVRLDQDVVVLANLVGCTREQARVGLPVKAVWGDMSDGARVLMFEPDRRIE